MKYKPEYYIDSGFYDGGMGECDIENHKEKVVKCRKSHECSGCNAEIKAGEYALYESGFTDGEPISCYTCLPCIEAWLEESGQVGFSDDESPEPCIPAQEGNK